ncbi:MAG: hypothetical protein M5U19_21630 [Microthrixaceae bacterium]|nr:hypothetical protein [Microthrixaceae bacterium]
MPAAVELPADPLTRLDSLITAVDVATAELDDAEEALRANAEQTGSVATDDRLPPLVARARELDRASAIVEKLEADLIELRTTEEHQACLLAEALRDLGADWTVQRVTTVDLSLPVFQRARGFAERTSTTRSQVEHALRGSRAGTTHRRGPGTVGGAGP